MFSQPVAFQSHFSVAGVRSICQPVGNTVSTQ
jgi:hypothetical protein